MFAKIAGAGRYLPKTILTNQELTERVDTTDEWIRDRVGISSRYIADEGETNALIATRAAQNALAEANIKPDQLDLIIVATVTQDNLAPATAILVQQALQAKCPAFDINGACSGFLYALNIANQYFKAGTIQHALVIGAERMSRITDWQDRGTCILFGDGAGAVVLSASDEPGIIASEIGAKGEYHDLLYTVPHLPKTVLANHTEKPVIKMEGNKVFKYAVETLEQIVVDILAKTHYRQEDIAWFIPHQANERIIVATAKKLNLPLEKVILTLKTHGNTSAASVPLALVEGIQSGRIKRGDLLLLEAFGAGFTFGACLIKY